MAELTQAAPPGRRRPLLARLRELLRARLAEWIRRRQGLDVLPAVLARRRLYILPTRAGAAFAVLLLLMLLAGLNYANSLALLLAFVLVAFALVAMQQCHRNLLGISVLALEAPAVFAQRSGALVVTLGNPSDYDRPRIEAALPDTAPRLGDLPPRAQQRIELPLPPTRRGIARFDRVRLSTAHPFGLFHAWTWIHIPLVMLIYPRPVGSRPMPRSGGQQSGARARGGADADEWAGLRPFRDGDSPRQVDWKAYARESPLLVKEYSPSGAELRLFDIDELTDPDVEKRLEQMARWVVDAEAQGDRYGIVLPGMRIKFDRGHEHRHRCLAALAVFGMEGLADGDGAARTSR